MSCSVEAHAAIAAKISCESWVHTSAGLVWARAIALCDYNLSCHQSPVGGWEHMMTSCSSSQEISQQSL